MIKWNPVQSTTQIDTEWNSAESICTTWKSLKGCGRGGADWRRNTEVRCADTEIFRSLVYLFSTSVENIAVKSCNYSALTTWKSFSALEQRRCFNMLTLTVQKPSALAEVKWSQPLEAAGDPCWLIVASPQSSPSGLWPFLSVTVGVKAFT